MARRTRTSTTHRVNQRRVKLLTAAATRIDLESKEDAQLQRKVRQNWQIQAWTYYDSIPELGFFCYGDFLDIDARNSCRNIGLNNCQFLTFFLGQLRTITTFERLSSFFPLFGKTFEYRYYFRLS